MPSELVRLQGHIIDSLILPKVLDEIMNFDGTFEILEIAIGRRKADTSSARLRIEASSAARLAMILRRLSRLGAIPEQPRDVRLVQCVKAGVFPPGFYSTTNLPTEIRFRGRWRKVQRIEMDCGIVVRPTNGQSICTPVNHIRRGDWVVCGSEGVKIIPLERPRKAQVFQFMGSAVSSEKPKSQLIERLANEMRLIRKSDRRILVVAGPAVVHTGSGPYLERLIQAGYVNVLFGGNGLATHDIESALYGTSLGVELKRGVPVQ
ncbi:MAG: TIGR00300 family protein, partial [Candidatus Omnitrophica bacterium]|nr:TIGR00300 family protein [Candidatus Omnitrophota bacterium]